MYLTSTSKIKSFHNWYNLGAKYDTKESIIEMIKGTKVFKVSFDLGNLVDSFITDELTGSETYMKLTKKLNMELHENGIQNLIEWSTAFKEAHSTFQCQPSGNVDYRTPLGDISVHYRTDISTLMEVYDIKTGKQAAQAKNYLRDFQGWIYCDALDVDTMIYVHFIVSHATNNVRHDKDIRQHRIRKSELVDIITQFVSFCKKEGIEQYILPKPVVTMTLSSTYDRGNKFKDVTLAKMVSTKDGKSYLQWVRDNVSDVILDEEILTLIK